MVNICVEWTLEKQQWAGSGGKAADGRVMGTGPREGGRAAQGKRSRRGRVLSEGGVIRGLVQGSWMPGEISGF